MFPDWNHLPEDLQIALAREAMTRAAAILAGQAEVLADEIETGGLADRGGADALRLFAAIIRANSHDDLRPVGMAEPAVAFSWR
jgi:hypothetical protein